MGKNFFWKDGDVSDGHHTFGELYEHRHLLFINLCLNLKQSSCWKEDQNTPGWFILYLNLPTGQISYHVPDRLLPLIDREIERASGEVWDGHTSDDVVSRLKLNAVNFQV